MTRVFDPDDDPAQNRPIDLLGEDDVINAMTRKLPGRAPRPRDAATLVLYRSDDNAPRILMGCRSKGHDFMPDKYVFPGGRVDVEDGRVASLSELPRSEEKRVLYRTRRTPRAFPLTAIRETFEETGLILGRPGETASTPPPSWAEYFQQGVAPCLKSFSFLGRAITPPMRHKRFDARFFMADATRCLIDDRPPIDGAELSDLRWFTLEEASELDLPNVTRYVISEVEQRLVDGKTLKPFFLRWSRQGHQRERIS